MYYIYMNNSDNKNNVKKVRKTTIKEVESPDTKTDKKIYNYGNRYKGKYKETQKKQYLKKKESMTPDDIQKWGWNISEQGWVNYPDVQGRLYRNKQSIFWAGKVHEKIQGYESYSIFPPEELYSIKHIKDIDRQRKQNDFYEQL